MTTCAAPGKVAGSHKPVDPGSATGGWADLAMIEGESMMAAGRRPLHRWIRATCATLLLAVHVATGAAEPTTLLWKDLLPPEWDSWHYYQNFYRLFPKVDDIDDKDPRALAILAEMRRISAKVPSRDDLDGRSVRVPGFIAPLRQGSAREIVEFLLVPYQGACIHRPPPPANQIVHVEPRSPVAAELVVRPVWVSGVIEVQRTETPLGSTTYRIRDARVELLDLDREGIQILRYRTR